MRIEYLRLLTILMGVSLLIFACTASDDPGFVGDGDVEDEILENDSEGGSEGTEDGDGEALTDGDEEQSDNDFDSEGEDEDEDEENDQPLCQCDLGPCCSDGCHFDTTDTVCDPEASSELGCPDGEGCGNPLKRRNRPRMCSGNSSGCDGELGDFGEWVIERSCGTMERCDSNILDCIEDRYSCDPSFCTAGVCCDISTNSMLGTEVVCDAQVADSHELQCSGTDCGSDLQQRWSRRYCSGDSPDCVGLIEPGEWEIVYDCEETQVCDVEIAACIDEPLCEDLYCDDSGPCCDMESNTRRGSDYVCAIGQQQRQVCSGDACGEDVVNQRGDRHCSGLSTACDGELIWHTTETVEDCGELQTCQDDRLECETNRPLCDPTYCESGPCCDDVSRTIRQQGRICEYVFPDTATYRCTGDGCGDDLEVLRYNHLCSGDSPDCTGETVPGDWVPHTSCTAEQRCDALAGRCYDDEGCLLEDCPEDMAAVDDFCIDLYEASRPDATAQSEGVDESRATSRAGVLPWYANPINSMELASFSSACQAAGKRLCRADEFAVTCGGASQSIYVYGNSFDPEICNSVDSFCDDYCLEQSIPMDQCNLSTNCGYAYGSFKAVPTGYFEGCTNETGCFDICGNAWETVLSDTDSRGFEIRGGAFNCASPAVRQMCGFNATWSNLYAGFRCCKDRELSER